MNIKKIKDTLGLEGIASQADLDTPVKGGYTGDLLSDVMGNSREGMLWITMQVHPNIIAVAKLKDLAGIILVNSRRPDENTVRKAEEEKVPLFISRDRAFEVSGKLYALLSAEE